MRLHIAAIVAVAFIATAAAATAQDGEFTADIDFLSPGTVFPHTSYDFTIRVTNETFSPPHQEWINEIRVQLPSLNYDVPVMAIESPEALHPEAGKSWQGEYTDAGGIGIFIWKFLTEGDLGDGDIQEGEVLDFHFTVITDAIPTDGFPWFAFSDSGAYDEGVAYFNPVNDPDDDDDDTDDDDADDDDDDDGDDDWHGDDDDVDPPDLDDDDDDGGLVTPPEEDEEDKSCGN